MCDIINIPYVDGDKRIGSAFNHLFSVISQTENCNSNTVTWNFKGSTFFHPFFLTPLALYKKSCNKKIICINKSKSIDSYFNLVHFEELLHIDKDTDLENSLKDYLNKSYTPICSFDLCSNNVDGLQTIIQSIIEKQSKADAQIKTPLSYFLGELICNISQHSQSNIGYISSQYLQREECIDVCIADNGITIYGSYVKANKYMDEIGDNEVTALIKANEGYSTKELPDPEKRGYGIISSKNMLVDGMKGAFFMLSGGAFHRHDKDGSVFIKLPPNIVWNGTIILMRIPIHVDDTFDYQKYIQ
ncbi:hypothetical protein [Bacteroides zoogleoformans]|uniref:hypothetical protein n=1 Tax=Bacteroides zoogleoformans TaxID=28119 RepID=UPI00248E858C|nr:hypothetical protein [Bacteroides zoogleoformans]